MPKLPVARARLRELGFEGDAVRHTRVHGGPLRAVCLYARERLDALREEGHDVFPGALGENVTLSGIDWALVRPGVALALGEARVEVTSYTTPCGAIAPFFAHGDSTRVHQDTHPGWSRVYARVLVAGEVRQGDVARLALDSRTRP